MSHQNTLEQWVSDHSSDVTLAKVGLAVSILLLGLRLLASQVLLVVIPLATGTACALYVGLHNRQDQNVFANSQYDNRLARPQLPYTVTELLPAVVLLAMAGLVALVRVAGHRTLPVYLLTGAIGTVILAQILLVEDERVATGPVLLQILLAAVVIRLSALFVTPGFVGVDIWTHVPVFIEGVIESGSISGLGDSKYIMAPLYHSIGAIAGLVFGDARVGVYLTMGLLVALSAVLVYVTARLFVTERWALLATALYAFADQFIRWGLHVIPTSLGLVFFLGALYCMTRLFVTEDGWSAWLLLAFSLAAVFTHQVSTAIVLLVLGIGAVVAVWQSFTTPSTSERRPPVRALGGVFLVSLVVTLVSWANTPWSNDTIFLWRMLDVLSERVSEAGFLDLASEGGAPVSTSQSTGLIVELLPFIELFGFGLLLSATVIGGLWMLKWDRSSGASYTFIAAVGVMFVAVFGLSLFGVRALLPGRWLAFLYALMAVVAAVGISHVSQHASRRVIVAVFVVLALGYPATMVVAEKATLDSPAFDNQQIRWSYTAAEVSGVETISTVHPSAGEGQLYGDHPYQTVFEPLGGYDARKIMIGENGTVADGPVVYREYTSNGPAVFGHPDDPEGSYERDVTESEVCSPDRNVVFANEEVKLCTQSSTTGEVSP